MRQALVLIALLALAPVAAVHVAPPAAYASQADLDRSRALVKEAQPSLEQAMNPDNDASTRKKGRKAAYKLLKEARRLLDAHLDGNPNDVDKLDREYCSVSSNLFWIKKFATLNEFRGSDDRTVELPGATTPDAGATGGGSSGGGIGGVSGGDDPPVKDDPPKKDDPPPIDDPPATGPVEPPVTEPDPPSAEELLVTRAREVLAALEEEEQKRPGDVAHLYALYEKYLFEFDDPSLPEYQKAALKLGALTDRMKTVLKEESGIDPDDFDVKDSAEVTRVVKRLTTMLKKGEPEERRRAAELLGKLGTGAAGFPLVNVLRDKDPEVARLAADGLVAIGGRRVAVNLTKVYRDRKPDDERAALDVLRRICEKGDVDARAVSKQLGRFMLSNVSAIAEDALAALTGLGAAGGPGLIAALETRNVAKKVAIMEALGQIRYARSASTMVRFLLRGDGKETVMKRNAAIASCKAIGTPAVPFLIHGLKGKSTKGWTAFLLREITGARLASRPREWQKWWEANGGGD